ncbi:hypothetical protein ES703_92170 [subsurface metagenome]
MRLPKRGERGFTLIELLIVVAILGVLAAVVIPNVTRFVGAGKQEAAETELHNVQLAVTSMMLENGIATIPNPLEAAESLPNTNHTNQMGLVWETSVIIDGFPDITSAVTTEDKKNDPDGEPYLTTDQDGYVLFGHDKNSGDGDLVNYVTVAETTHYYTCEADGTVQQWGADGLPIVWD